MALSANGNGCWTWIAIAVVAVVVWQCTRDNTSDEVSTAAYSSYSSVEAPETDYSTYAPPTSDYSVEEYRSVSSGYQEAGTPYGCTQDCSGHEAGWSWAEENGVTEPSDCGGNSMSFEEGCIAYAEEQEAERPDEDRW